MNLDIKITTSDSCKVIIEDISNYLSEQSTSQAKNNFKYSDTISLAVLKLNKVKEAEYKKYKFFEHMECRQFPMEVKFDGWFTVNYIVLPSSDWFYKELNKEVSSLNLYNTVYFTDGSTIYKYINGNIETATVEEIVEINTVNTTLSRISKDYVSICYLRKCYIDLCQQIFESRGFSSCWNKSNIDSELIYKRDLTWMAINVIKYLTECEQLYEVERIIELIKGCNGLCPSKNSTSNTSGCGCSR